LQYVYKNGALFGVHNLDNCKIIDADNWSCGSGMDASGVNQQWLSEGVFVSKFSLFNRQWVPVFTSPTCAKKKIFFGLID
jgi:hypothetical protein